MLLPWAPEAGLRHRGGGGGDKGGGISLVNTGRGIQARTAEDSVTQHVFLHKLCVLTFN